MSNEKKNKPKIVKVKFNEMWFYGFILLSLGILYFWDGDNAVQKELSWDKFRTYAIENSFSEINIDRKEYKAQAVVRKDAVDKVFTDAGIKNDRLKKAEKVVVTTQFPSVDRFATFYDEAQLSTKGVKLVYEDSGFSFWGIFLSFGPIILMVFLWFYLMKRMSGGAGGGPGGVFSVGKSKAKLHDKTKMKVSFADVAGLQEAKEEVEEIVHFLKNPKKYTHLGGKIPKGALLVGPPGTGKTLLAKAVAGEADVPFFSMSGSDFVEMFVGVGASRVRDLFEKAKEKSPCIVFIDEIDAVGRARGKNNNMGGNDERENTLNQLLTEMDGFGSNSGIIVMAATNRVDVLDSALLRAGRFDRQIYVDLPDVNDRKEIFLVHLKEIKTDESLDLDLLARQTPGFSGADIANICNEAALIAARNDKDFVTKDDFMNAVDRVVGGLEKKNKITTEEERKSIAIHEAGHATVSWFTRYGNPLVKVTIVPRGKALGAAWYLPEERQITTTQALLDQMCGLLAGRAAEELFLGRISTGAANDLERTTQIAYAMVTYYGMSNKLPHLNYAKIQGDSFGISKPYSDKTADLIDQEVSTLIQEQYDRAKALLQEHTSGHNELSELLLKEEVIYTADVERILGKRQWISRSDELEQEQEADKLKGQKAEENAEQTKEEAKPREEVIVKSEEKIKE